MTSAEMRARLASERGAVVVTVGLALLAFTLMSAFVVDYGIQLVSRNQIQNAVDASALAGATALAFDDYSDHSATGAASLTAVSVAGANRVWSDAPTAATTTVAFPVCADSYVAAPSAPPRMACIEVTAHRDDTGGNPIPALISTLMGITSFGVQASAIAEAIDANATDCLRPLAIPDRWNERTSPPWAATSSFDKSNPDPLLRDRYTPPNQLGAGDGLTFSGHFGAHVTLNPGVVAKPLAAWSYLPVRIPGSRWGANAVRANMAACAVAQITLRGDAVETRLDILAGSEASVADGARDLIARDPGAAWNPATRRIEGSCANSVTPCASVSPRVIAVALYDPNDLTDAIDGGAADAVRVTNMVGLFIESVAGNDITGYITRHPGQKAADDLGVMTLYEDSSFLRMSTLVQ